MGSRRWIESLLYPQDYPTFGESLSCRDYAELVRVNGVLSGVLSVDTFCHYAVFVLPSLM